MQIYSLFECNWKNSAGIRKESSHITAEKFRSALQAVYMCFSDKQANFADDVLVT